MKRVPMKLKKRKMRAVQGPWTVDDLLKGFREHHRTKRLGAIQVKELVSWFKLYGPNIDSSEKGAPYVLLLKRDAKLAVNRESVANNLRGCKQDPTSKLKSLKEYAISAQ